MPCRAAAGAAEFEQLNPVTDRRGGTQGANAHVRIAANRTRHPDFEIKGRISLDNSMFTVEPRPAFSRGQTHENPSVNSR